MSYKINVDLALIALVNENTDFRDFADCQISFRGNSWASVSELKQMLTFGDTRWV